MSPLRRLPPMNLRLRIGILLFAGVLGAGLGLHVLLLSLSRQRLLKELDARGQSLATLLASRMSTTLVLQDREGMRTELRRALREPEMIGVEVYDARGVEFEKVVRDPQRWVSEIDLGSVEGSEHRAREKEQLDRARAHEAEAPIFREGLDRGQALGEAGEIYGLDAPGAAAVDDKPIGWVRMVYGTDSVDDAVATASRMGLTVLLGALAIWLLPLFGLLRFIAEPLREASDLARAIAQGELERRIPVRSSDELGTLATSLNTMALALTEAREQARMEALTMRRTSEAVVAISQGARDARGVEDLFDVIAQQLRQVTECEGAALALPAGEEPFSRFQRFDPALPWGELRPGLVLDPDLLRRVNEAGTAPLRLDVHREETPLIRSLRREGFRTALLVPLAEHAGRSSSLLLASKREGAFPPSQLEVVVGLASHLGSAIRASILHARLESAVSELEETRVRLERSERLRVAGEMASGVAHDFNNLLGAILGRAQLLRRRAAEGALPAADLVRALEIIERAATDGGETVRRLRQFGVNVPSEDTEIVDLDEAIRDASEFTRARWESEAQAASCPIQLVIESVPGATVRGRASQMREVFTNLILNAVDALPGGGTIRLSTETQGEHLLAVIEDDGVGMPPAVQKRIFDPFFTTKGPQGTGLGLSVVYGIVVAAGGEIAVRSEPGHGTRIQIKLPRAVPEIAPAAPARVNAAAAPALQVMVVDDEPAVRDLLIDILRSLGQVATGFDSGAHALESYAAGRFDLIFTDLGMPGMSGWDLARAIRERDPQVTLAIITGWGAEVSPEAAEEAGADAVVGKPFTIEDIEGLIRVARDRRPMRAA